jgi:O-antigen ligase
MICIGIVAFFALAPGRYGDRLESILNPSADPSATTRRALLYISTKVALEHPLLGVGMGNFHHLSIRDKASHNSYTQVAADMGFPALVLYLMFIIVPFKRLREIESETFAVPQYSRIHYLAVGLQASLVGYMVGSFFLSVAYYWYIYYLVGYTICLRRYETGPGRVLGRATLQSTMLEEDNEEDSQE